jgi:hypothetical protein
MALTKSDVLREFNDTWADPAAAKFGDVFEERVERVARELLLQDRAAVLEVLRDWIAAADAPTALVAVRLSSQFTITELLPAVEALDTRIREGRVLLPYHAEWTRPAIARLRAATTQP